MTIDSARIESLRSFCTLEIAKIEEKSMQMIRAVGAIVGIAMFLFGCVLGNEKLWLGGIVTGFVSYLIAEDFSKLFHFLTDIPRYERACLCVNDSNFMEFAKEHKMFGETTILSAIDAYQMFIKAQIKVISQH